MQCGTLVDAKYSIALVYNTHGSTEYRCVAVYNVQTNVQLTNNAVRYMRGKRRAENVTRGSVTIYSLDKRPTGITVRAVTVPE